MLQVIQAAPTSFGTSSCVAMVASAVASTLMLANYAIIVAHLTAAQQLTSLTPSEHNCNLFVEVLNPNQLVGGCQYYANNTQDSNCEALWSRVSKTTVTEAKKPERVLVTGGAGFVGSHLVDSLMLDGAHVTVLDNFMTGRRVNIAHWLDHPNFDLITADVIDQKLFQGLQSHFDHVYHLASPASPAHYMIDPVKTILTNTIGTNNALELAVRDNCKILLASTSEIYGDPMEHPQSESYWGNVNPVGPRSCYDESKRLAESMVSAYIDTKNISARIARIFNTYGPRMQIDDGRVVSNLVIQAIKDRPLTVYGDGEQTRSFQYVTDLVAGLRSLMDSDVMTPVNLGNPDEQSINKLADKIKRLVPKSNSQVVFERLPIDDPHRRRPDINKASRSLGWRPRVQLDEGLARTVEYFEQELVTDRHCQRMT